MPSIFSLHSLVVASIYKHFQGHENQLQARSFDRIRFSINSRTTNLSVVATGYLWGFLTVTYLWFGIVSQKKSTTNQEETMPSLFHFKKCSNSQFCHSHVLKRKQGGDNSSVTFLDVKSPFCSNRMNLEQVTTIAKMCFHLPSEITILLLR